MALNKLGQSQPISSAETGTYFCKKVANNCKKKFLFFDCTTICFERRVGEGSHPKFSDQSYKTFSSKPRNNKLERLSLPSKGKRPP